MSDDLLLKFDYQLPNELIAQEPSEVRVKSKLLIVDKRNYINLRKNNLSKTIEDSFSNLPLYLNKGDLLILNDSKVIPARLKCHKLSGGKVEVFIIEEYENKDNSSKYFAKALIRSNRKISKELQIKIENSHLIINVEKINFTSSELYLVSTIKPFYEILKKYGEIPLPPYINRSPTRNDQKRYQTIYAKNNGSIAAPTAGLHFDNNLLTRLKEKGIQIGYITLHIGLGTFKTIREKYISNHVMHEESFQIPEKTVDKILNTIKNKKKIIAVGTTSLRAIESAFIETKNRTNFIENIDIKTGIQSTNLFIKPGFEFKVVNGLITNFHLPKSTLIILVSAFLGREYCMKIYKDAIQRKFRFFSYGDSMLAFRPTRSFRKKI